MNIRSIIGNIGKRGLKDITNKKVISAYLDYVKIQADGLTIPESELVAYSEQLIWRMNTCKPCVEAGVCDKCDCPQPSGMLTPSYTCKGKRFQEMLPAKEWEQFKKTKNIIISVYEGIK